MTANAHPSVALVGMGCRFPGGVVDVEGFWKLLLDERDAITQIPADRIEIERYFDPRPATPGRMMSRWGGYLDGIQDFDADFFGLSPREAERLDPQQRLLLETAWEAVEDAGVDARTLDGSRTGVFIGQWTSDFEGRVFADPEAVDFHTVNGSGRYAASGRLSYFLGLRGPSLTIDTACSSSLAAVHLAVRSIQSGESTLALAGGVNLILQPQITIAYSQSLMMAADGRCKFGDTSGDGYVRSEGAGVVLLKPLDRAIADGDRIYAVIRGGAINNDGRSSGLMGRPSQIGQEELLRTAYEAAGVSPADVGYVEAHGTGTRAGDPVEVSAIGAVLGEGRPAGRTLLLGSVKTNIGHTEGAAGVAGLIKAALTVQTGVVPANLHLKTPNPAIVWGPCSIATSRTGWPEIAGPRYAGVGGFGISGANAHVVLQEPPAAQQLAEGPAHSATPLPLSAKSVQALRALAGRYADLMEDETGPSLAAVAWNAAVRRTPLDHRVAFVASNRAEMVQALRDYAAGGPVAAEGIAGAAPPKVAFVFPGQGGQWQGMARRLMAQDAQFRDAIERCDAAARPYIGWSILEQIETDTPSLETIDVVQPILTAVSIAYAERLRAAGVTPDAVVGHSMGEAAAAYIAGAIDLDAAMRIICRRSALMRTVAGQGAMAMVELGMAEAEERIGVRQNRVGVAVSNSPRSTVISGDPAVVQEIVAELTADGIFARLVKVDVASHSPQMEPLAGALAEALQGLEAKAASLPFYSTVLARAADGAELDAAYWGRNLRHPVQFGEATKALLADGVTMFLECGPHPVLLPAVQQTAQANGVNEVLAVCTGDRDRPEYAELLTTLAALWTNGHPVDWRSVLHPASFTRLPLYPWRRERHWVETAELSQQSAPSHRLKPRAQPVLADKVLAPEWADAAKSEGTRLREWLLLPDQGGVAKALSELCAAEGQSCSIAASAEIEGGKNLAVIDLRSLDGADLAEDAYDLLRLVRLASPPARVFAVTRAARAVEPAERASIDVRAAAIWGLGAGLATEHGDVFGGCIDLEAGASPAASAKALFDHLRTGLDGDVALRGGRRLQPRLRTAPVEGAQRSFGFRPDAAYLVTGGLGALGLTTARWMVEQGARRLVILGRTPLPERRLWKDSDAPAVAAVRELEALGAAVTYASVNVADDAAIAAFLSAYVAENWPPIRGLVHAAGIADERLAIDMEKASMAAVLGGKAQGAINLDRLLPELDFFVLFSSMAAMLPEPGQAAYAAANAVLDTLAIQRNGRGQAALSIGWGPWCGLGMVAGAEGEARVDQMRRQGIDCLDPNDAVALLPQLIAQGEPHVLVVRADWAKFRQAHAGRDYSALADLLPRPDVGASLETPVTSLDPAERRKALESGVREAVGRVLRLPAARVESRRALGDMGLTSLLSMELRDRLETLVGRPLSATTAFNYPNVEALVTYLAGEAEPPPSTAAVAPVVEEAAVVAMSEDEALQLLRRRR